MASNVSSMGRQISREEMDARVDLAACYRLAHHFGWTDTIYNHISLRIPGRHDQYLINPFGLMYDEITATNLTVVDADCQIIHAPTGMGVNPAGFVIHGAIHAARADIACVMHTHTPAGMGVSAQRHGLLPISQHAAMFHNALAYHDSEGIAVHDEERERLVEDLGDKRAMILRNHGLLTAGATVGEALQRMINLETACRGQVAALAGGGELTYLKHEALASTEETVRTLTDFGRDWAALKRLADRVAPDYRV